MTFKELRKVLVANNPEFYDTSLAARQGLSRRLMHKPFWIWNGLEKEKIPLIKRISKLIILFTSHLITPILRKFKVTATIKETSITEFRLKSLDDGIKRHIIKL